MKVNHIYNGDCLEVLKILPDESVNCCITSPPYWGLRDYGVDGQLGLEETPERYVEKVVAIFSEVKRVLKKDGTLWLNLGDSYIGGGRGGKNGEQVGKDTISGNAHSGGTRRGRPTGAVSGYKSKDLVGIPWMVAFALRADGWYLRQDIIWSKPNPMPESVTDRCTKAHEYIFILSKSKKYYYDQVAIMEPAVWDVSGDGTKARKARQKEGSKSDPTIMKNGIRGYKDAKKFKGKHSDKQGQGGRTYSGFNERYKNKETHAGVRNKRSVWTVTTRSFKEAHFATFPERLITDCIKAGCPEDGIVLDPFMGAGTTGLVSRKLNRNYVGIELNYEYIEIAERRMKSLGLFR